MLQGTGEQAEEGSTGEVQESPEHRGFCPCEVGGHPSLLWACPLAWTLPEPVPLGFDEGSCHVGVDGHRRRFRPLSLLRRATQAETFLPWSRLQQPPRTPPRGPQENRVSCLVGLRRPVQRTRAETPPTHAHDLTAARAPGPKAGCPHGWRERRWSLPLDNG